MFSNAVSNKGTPARKHQADVLQSGRSMIEMLGVLAIIGMLSVGGISGYSKAMMQYLVNKAIEQISQISQNVRTAFAAQRNYAELTSTSENGLKLIKKAKLVPEEMIDDNNTIDDEDGLGSHHIFNPFGGGVVVWNDQEVILAIVEIIAIVSKA